MKESMLWIHSLLIFLWCVFSVVRADPIHEAAESGDVDQVRKLLNEGADVNAPDLDGTPLQWALFANQIAVAHVLLQHGADPNVSGWDGTLLESAALNANTEVVGLLLEHGGNPNRGDKSTPLVRAIQSGSLEIVDLLLLRGADPNVPTIDGNYPLHEAARERELEIAKRLVDSGVDVNALNGVGWPAIHFAVRNKHTTLTEYLRRMGAMPGEVEPINNLLPSADLAQGELDTKRECDGCHSVVAVYPPLWNVVGRPQGDVAGYDYSPVFRALEGEWTYDALNEFLARPTEVIPGTKMELRGIADPKTRANIIGYLRTLSDEPVPLP